MNKLSTTFLIFLFAINLLLPVLSQATIIQSKSFQLNAKQGINIESEESITSAKFDCLPEGFKLSDVVSYRHKDGRINIKDKLIEMKARCKDGKLIDSKGREIKFFKVACYGNPPADYDEIAQKEREELEKLQKDYTVIVMECDPHIS
jgi:hypothetical protein